MCPLFIKDEIGEDQQPDKGKKGPQPVDLKCPTQKMVPEHEKYQEYELRSV